MNRIISEGRSHMGNMMLNSLCISIDGPSLESFDAQPAINEVHRRPGYRKPKSQHVSLESVTDTCLSSEYELSSDDSSDHEGVDSLSDDDLNCDCEVVTIPSEPIHIFS